MMCTRLEAAVDPFSSNYHDLISMTLSGYKHYESLVPFRDKTTSATSLPFKTPNSNQDQSEHSSTVRETSPNPTRIQDSQR